MALIPPLPRLGINPRRPSPPVARRSSGVILEGENPGVRRFGTGVENVTAFFQDYSSVISGMSALVVGCFTVVLALVTSRQAKLTGKVADAALLQATIMKAVEDARPIISDIKLVEYTDLASSDAIADRVLPGPIPQFCRVLPHIQNTGRTSARITRFSISWLVSDTLPAVPIYEGFVQLGLLLGQGASTWFRVDPLGDMRLTDQERQLIEFGRAALWISGLFSYTSYFAQSFDVGFIARWDLRAGLVVETRPNYTYEREVEQ
jgi:hypothetical protein